MKYAKFDIPPPVALFVNALSLVEGFVQSKAGSFTYNLTTASGTQSITSVGFQPAALIIIAAVVGAEGLSVGLSDVNANANAIVGVSNAAIFDPEGGSLIVWSDGAGANSQIATLSSYIPRIRENSHLEFTRVAECDSILG